MFCGLAEIWRRLSTVRQSAMQNDAKLLRKATERTKLNELKMPGNRPGTADLVNRTGVSKRSKRNRNGIVPL